MEESHEHLPRLANPRPRHYAQRHGFPFIVNVLVHSKAQIFAALRERTGHDTPGEIDAALEQIAAITRRRLNALLGAA